MRSKEDEDDNSLEADRAVAWRIDVKRALGGLWAIRVAADLRTRLVHIQEKRKWRSGSVQERAVSAECPLIHQHSLTDKERCTHSHTASDT